MTPDQQKLNAAQLANNKELEDIQKPHKVGQKVGLGVIHEDLKKLNETLSQTKSGSAPAAGRQPLPKYSMGGQALDPRNPTDAKLIKLIQEADTAAAPAAESATFSDTGPDNTAGSADEDRVERLTQIGSVIQAKLNNQPINQTQSSINASVFSNFVEQTKNRENLLKDATEEQKQIFADLENAIIDLREAGGEESDELRKTLAALQGTLSTTEPTTAKGSIENIISAARTSAAAPSLKGIAQTALSGDFTGAIRKTGQFGMSKIDNLGERWFGESSQRPTERSTELGAILKALKEMKSGRPAAAADRTPKWAKKLEAMATPGSRLADAKVQPSGPPEIRIDNIDTLNVKAKNVKLEGDIEGSDGGGLGGILPLGRRNTVAAGGPGKSSGKIIQKTDSRGRKYKVDTATGRRVPMSTPTSSRFKMPGLGKLGGGLGGIVASVGLDYAADALGRDTTAGASADIASQTLGLAGTGALIGSVIPGVGTAIGAGIGGAIGLGKGLYDNSSTIFNRSAQAVPKDQGSTVQQQSQHNDQLRERERKPVVIVPPATVQPQANNSNTQVLMPVSGVRPTENAYVRYTNRSSAFN